MELKDFIKKVLTDLVDAVEETRSASVRDMRLSNNIENRTVEFDIAVSVEDVNSKSGKAGIRVLQFAEAGGDISKETKNSTVSRVKFGVNVDGITKIENQEASVALEAINNRSYK